MRHQWINFFFKLFSDCILFASHFRYFHEWISGNIRPPQFCLQYPISFYLVPHISRFLLRAFLEKYLLYFLFGGKPCISLTEKKTRDLYLPIRMGRTWRFLTTVHAIPLNSNLLSTFQRKIFHIYSTQSNFILYLR